MYKFSKTSKRRLKTCDPKLQRIANKAIQYVDFSVITGHRNKHAQNKLYPRYTKVKWPYSKHNSYPSQAIDIAPYIKPYGTITGSDKQIREIAKRHNLSIIQTRNFILKAYARLIGIFEGIAFQHGIKLRLGIDWDGDFDMLDQSFHDLGHIELKEFKYVRRHFWEA